MSKNSSLNKIVNLNFWAKVKKKHLWLNSKLTILNFWTQFVIVSNSGGQSLKGGEERELSAKAQGASPQDDKCKE